MSSVQSTSASASYAATGASQASQAHNMVYGTVSGLCTVGAETARAEAYLQDTLSLSPADLKKVLWPVPQ